MSARNHYALIENKKPNYISCVYSYACIPAPRIMYEYEPVDFNADPWQLGYIISVIQQLWVNVIILLWSLIVSGCCTLCTIKDINNRNVHRRKLTGNCVH